LRKNLTSGACFFLNKARHAMKKTSPFVSPF
jgi:hypothetical protein